MSHEAEKIKTKIEVMNGCKNIRSQTEPTFMLHSNTPFTVQLHFTVGACCTTGNLSQINVEALHHLP